MTTSAPRRTLPARSGAPTSASKQFSGNPTPSGWRIKGQCVATWPSSSASSPLQCRNMLALYLGRKT
ncbi:DSCAML1 isoform 1, partial [Pan troglodytes]